MHLFQQAKAPLHTKLATKLFLVLTSLPLCLTALFLLAGTPTASAASVGSRSTPVTPATHGGGCATDSTGSIRVCISENSQFVVVPDAYILKYLCNVHIDLSTTASTVTSKSFGSNCYPAGTHLYGYSSDAYQGSTWFAEADGTNHFHVLGISPYLYT